MNGDTSMQDAIREIEAVQAWHNRPVAVGEQVRVEYAGRIYENGRERAAFGKPVWECPHRHESLHAAEQCADLELSRRGSA